MDYTVGSIADLISGTNTPNKLAVVKEFVKLNTSIQRDANNENESATKRNKRQNKERKHKSNTNSYSQLTTIDHTEVYKLENEHNDDESATKRNKKKNKERKHKSSTNSYSHLTTIDHTEVDKLEKEHNEDESATAKKKKKNKERKHKSSTNSYSHLTTIDHTEVDKLEKERNKDVIDEIMETNEHEESLNGNVSIADEESTKSKNIDTKELDSRTIFVGNVPITVKKIQLLRLFGKYGKVLSARLRCVTPANPNISKRVAVIKKMLHPKRTTLHCYVTFEKREDALKATELNGQKYKEHYLRVQMCDDTSQPENSKAIFIGNLPFEIEDDDLWNTFESCGPIVSVRVVRSSSTGMGIGIGYVNFSSSDSVELALQMEDVILKNKRLRIQRCHDKKTAHKEKYQKKSKKTKNKNKQKSINTHEEGGVQEKSKKATLFDKASDISVKSSLFQGSKSNKKKQKQKVNKGVAKKLKLSQKIAPRN